MSIQPDGVHVGAETLGSRIGPNPLCGAMLGDLEVLSLVGEGAMAHVYKAWDRRLHRHAALKVMKGDIGDENLRERLYAEARNAGVLQHPNIVTIYDIHDADGIPAIEMAFIDGQTLRRKLTSSGALPHRAVMAILWRTLDALECAHKRGIIHRDIKPSNLLVTEDSGQCVFLADFGISRATRSPRLTAHGHILGTPAYMAPEVWDGAASESSDLYALGITGYELLAARLPFDGDLPELAKAHCYRAVPAISVPGIPPELSAFIARLVAKLPSDRPASAADAKAELGALMLRGTHDETRSPKSQSSQATGSPGYDALIEFLLRSGDRLLQDVPTQGRRHPRESPPSQPPPPGATPDGSSSPVREFVTAAAQSAGTAIGGLMGNDLYHLTAERLRTVDVQSVRATTAEAVSVASVKVREGIDTGHKSVKALVETVSDSDVYRNTTDTVRTVSDNLGEKATHTAEVVRRVTLHAFKTLFSS